MEKDKLSAIIGIIIILIFFLLTSYLVKNNLNYIEYLIGAGYISMLIFIFILIVSTVIAPVNAVPLLPVASFMWGWFTTGILSIIGWTIGAMIAFGLSRNFGVPLVKKFVPLKDIGKYEKLIPEKNLFWSIVFLRMSIPVDILSYILGLFSHIRYSTYFFATLVGITPLAFVLAYAGTLPVKYQIIAFLAAIIALLIGLKIRQMYKLRKMLKEKAKDFESIVKTDQLNILKTDVLKEEIKELTKK